MRNEGVVLAQDLAHAPSGAMPLALWWSGEAHRADNFTTSDRAWQGEQAPGGAPYRLVGRQGYVLSRPFAGTEPLGLWWSGSRTDNHTTAAPTWREGSLVVPGEYRFGGVQGWIRRADGRLPVEPPQPFGFADQGRSGRKGLLVIVCEYRDGVIDPTVMEDLGVEGHHPNLFGMFHNISCCFSWAPAVVVNVRFDENFAEASVPEADHDVRAVQLAVNQAGIDLAVFDGDADGVVTGDDLVVMTVLATGSTGGQTRGLSDTLAGGVRLQGVPLCANGDGGDIRLFAHELLHTLDIDQHIYGPKRAKNRRASLFAANGRRGDPDAGPIHLDPWTKLLAGWVTPRVMSITRAGGVAKLPAAQLSAACPDLGPLVFYDPARGRNELLIVEYRTPRVADTGPDRNFDSAVLGQGIAVWYVRRGADGRAVGFEWPPPIVPERSGNMLANFYLGPQGMAEGRFWTSADGEFALSWPDGSDTGLRMQIAKLGEDTTFAHVMWWHADTGFLPRLDHVNPGDVPAGTRQTLLLQGLFPPVEEVRVQLSGLGGAAVEAEASVSTNLSVHQIKADVDVPPQPGWYETLVTRRDGSQSNGALLRVR